MNKRDVALMEWLRSKDNPHILTLDGSLGGCNGMEFSFLSNDCKACDDWHIGKNYNMQRWLRYPIVISRNVKNNLHIKIAEGETHNGYIVLNKRWIRTQNKHLIRSHNIEIETIGDEIVFGFIKKFNDFAN